MTPRSDPSTASDWRRTRHLWEALELVRYLDGTRTVPEAGRLAGFPHDWTGWRALASLRALAAEAPHLVELREQADGRRTLYRVTLLPGVQNAGRAEALAGLTVEPLEGLQDLARQMGLAPGALLASLVAERGKLWALQVEAAREAAGREVPVHPARPKGRPRR